MTSVVRLNRWRKMLKFDPIPSLASSQNKAILFFTRRDLFIQNPERIEELCKLPEPTRIIRKQQENGSWIYRGGNLNLRAPRRSIISSRPTGILGCWSRNMDSTETAPLYKKRRNISFLASRLMVISEGFTAINILQTIQPA
jgi:hypothetical protein